MSVIETKVKPIINTKNNTTVIPNQKYPDKPSLIRDKFFDYDIYHVCINGVEMYAVTEFIYIFYDCCVHIYTVDAIMINSIIKDFILD